MPTDDGELDGHEIVMIIEALDALIPFSDETRRLASETERQVWAGHDALRARLKQAVHMSFYDGANGWLESELRREREATIERLFSRLSELMRDPKATRRTVREGFIARAQELRDARQSAPKPLS